MAEVTRDRPVETWGHVTDDGIAALDDEQFAQVWAAMGTVVLARAARTKRTRSAGCDAYCACLCHDTPAGGAVEDARQAVADHNAAGDAAVAALARVEALRDEWADADEDGECPDGLCGACTLGNASELLTTAIDGAGDGAYRAITRLREAAARERGRS